MTEDFRRKDTVQIPAVAGWHVLMSAKSVSLLDESRPITVAADIAAERQAIDQFSQVSLGRRLPPRQKNASRRSVAVDQQFDLGADSSTRLAAGLIRILALLPALVCRRRTSVEMIDCSDRAASISSTFSHIPCAAPRAKELSAVRFGRDRLGWPYRQRCLCARIADIPSKPLRLPSHGRPVHLQSAPGSDGITIAHFVWLSLKHTVSSASQIRKLESSASYPTKKNWEHNLASQRMLEFGFQSEELTA